ncbi:MAG TPA: hypothetical protein VN894_10030 [Polyangiaceae bacterium]|nr:hypothetical protein [Polyangiaceae bacterium]
MSTREQTRRDLQDLAKLAAAMPKEHSSSLPPRQLADYGSVAPGASRITVPPTVASLPPPPPLPRLPRAFSVSGTPPPQAWSIPAAFAAAAAALRGSSRLRGTWLVAAGSTLVAALVSGLLLGQSLSSHAAAASTNESPPRSAAPAVAFDGVLLAEPTAAVAPSPGAGAPPGAAQTVTAVPSPAASVLEVCAPVATFRAPRPNHHSEPKPAPKPAAGHHDSLDDLIRKAASN